MDKSIVRKIIDKHLVDGEIQPGNEISIIVQQTLIDDTSGTMVGLELESLGKVRLNTRFSIIYVDHNLIQAGPNSADDHRFLQTIAERYGIYYSKAGNGICHQIHLEQFAMPGEILVGTDSHTPCAGSVGMFAVGAGGVDVVAAMISGKTFLIMPKICRVNVVGELNQWCTGRDVILEILKRLGVEGGIGKVFEYQGLGVKNLSINDRATICTAGSELGLTSSIFPSDQITKLFFKSHSRENDWVELAADDKAEYDETIVINLSEIEPLIAKPHSPDNVVQVKELVGTKIHQVVIGSCANSSLKDLMVVASVLKAKKVNPNVSLVISPGSRRVFQAIINNGILETLVSAGARILELGCGPCCGMGQSPESSGVSIRTTTRNFKGRSGTQNALIYLASPETAVASAIMGEITDPRSLGEYPLLMEDIQYVDNLNLIIKPNLDYKHNQIIKGPNIKSFPVIEKPGNSFSGNIVATFGNNISTDDILPSGPQTLPLRSNIPAISEYAFINLDTSFVKKCKKYHRGLIIAGDNFGQGSSREHAAIVLMFLGIKIVIAKSFARIHKQNLYNFGIIPLVFNNKSDYYKVKTFDYVTVDNITESIIEDREIVVRSSRGYQFSCVCDLTRRQKEILLHGGLLNYINRMRPI